MTQGRRLKLTVAYDGTDYHGFQRQPGGLPTVQEHLERALSGLATAPVRVVPAGRTDAGVHAAGQVLHCDFSGTIPVDRIPRAANGQLPDDIVIYDCHEVDPEFHARFSATSKVYRYSILQSEFRWPFIHRHVIHQPRPLSVEAMQAAVPYLKGRRDFAAFQATGRPVASTVRNLFRLEVHEQKMHWGSLLHLTFEADGFLYHMVRNMVGTLLEVGTGRRSQRWVAEVLEGGCRDGAGPTAPPAGLTLMEVKYGVS